MPPDPHGTQTAENTMTPFGESVTEQTVTLVRKKLALTTRLPRAVVESMRVDAADMLTDDIVVNVRAYVFGERLPAHTETRSRAVPTSWWQHLKWDYATRWWMRWLVHRRPVRMEWITLTTTWENMAAYPWADLRTQLPEARYGSAVRLSFLTSSLSTDYES